MRVAVSSIILAALHCTFVTQAQGQSPLTPPDATVLTEARAIVQSMIDNPRGPYSRIRWFCADGSVLPPTAFACKEHGGGRQHGEYSAERQRLAELGWSVGTIFAALDAADLTDAASRRYRLRELPLERYLMDVDDGWVLRRARSYRGRAQAEGEDDAGRLLLLALYGDTNWLQSDFMLARESSRVIPHTGIADDVARDVRRQAVELAEATPSFEALRAEIHSAPRRDTATRVRAWAARQSADTELAANELAVMLDSLYGDAGRSARLERHASALTRSAAGRPLAEKLTEALTLDLRTRLATLSEVLSNARSTSVAPTTSASLRLTLFDLINELEAEVGITSSDILADSELSRRELFNVAVALMDASYGAGFLSERERIAVVEGLKATAGTADLSVTEYDTLVTALRRVPQWAAGAVRFAFAEPITRYAALDARAAQFSDDILRGSPLLPLGDVTRRLARDAAKLTGVGQNINGESGLAAFGLNPGIARGTLKIINTERHGAIDEIRRADIAVIPETTPELPPVAGIVTMGEGNPLSHVQLLARNFGIPNIAIGPNMLRLIEPLAGQQVLAAVDSTGSLALLPESSVPDELLELLTPANQRGAQLRVPTPELQHREPILLDSLRAGLSGRVVGPKAANLGELAYLFPGRVAPALALPFGVFNDHLSRGEDSPRARLTAAYAAHAGGTLNDAELDVRLADIRRAIAATLVTPEFRAVLSSAMAEEFGEPGTYGVFVRSDTNVEDLPEFTGAGLSETLPNIVGSDAIFAAIPRVWASVLSARAIAWRSSLLVNPSEVYASVLIMQSVPSEKSGVMVTTNVAGKAPGVTVSTAWGVGGGVGGEATETIVLLANGSETLISEAKAPYGRRLNPAGGLDLVPVADGAVLTPGDKAALRELSAAVIEKYTPALDAEGNPRPWDIEFGFVDGELTLFQIRPLVERGQQLADRVVAELVPQRDSAADLHVMLDALPQY
jgi:hypothetical protein